MAGLDNVESIRDNFTDNAGALLVEVDDMKSIENGQTLSFKLPDAMDNKDSLMGASRFVMVEDKEAFLRDPAGCPSATVDVNNIDVESFNFFNGTATINVDNMNPQLTQDIADKGCVVAQRTPDTFAMN